jgi:hypothetical protein
VQFYYLNCASLILHVLHVVLINQVTKQAKVQLRL